MVISRSSGGWGDITFEVDITSEDGRLSFEDGGNKLVVRRMGDITFEVEVDITSQLHDKDDFFEENYLRWPSHHLTSEDLKLT